MCDNIFGFWFVFLLVLPAVAFSLAISLVIIFKIMMYFSEEKNLNG